MKKKLFIFLGIFIFMIIPKNTYAAISTGSYLSSFEINNTEFKNNQASLTYNGTNAFTLTSEIITNYPYNYYAIYFKSPISYSNLNYAFGVSLGGGCNSSCFSNNVYVKPIGVNYYAIVLPRGKIDCGVGTGACMISNNVYLYSAVATDVNIIGVDAFDDDTLIDNSFANFLNIINNQNNNTDRILNTFNSYLNNVTTSFNSSLTTVTNSLSSSINNNQAQTNQRLDNLNNSINDDTTDTSYQNSTLDNLNTQMASNNVISDLLLLPVRMYQKILDSLGSNSCVAYNLGSLYGTNLQFPCIQVQNYIGSALWTTIDLIFCGMFILVIRKKFVDIFNNMTNLKDGGNEIE